MERTLDWRSGVTKPKSKVKRNELLDKQLWLWSERKNKIKQQAVLTNSNKTLCFHKPLILSY